MTAVYKRELRALFGSLHGWLYMSGALFLLGAFSAYHHFLLGSADIGSMLCLPIYLPLSFGKGYLYIPQLSFWMAILLPVLGMYSLPNDRRDGTANLLLSLPIQSGSIVLGKYGALLTVYAVPTAVLCVLPLVFSKFGTVDFAAAYAAILLYFLLGAAGLAVSLFMSSLTVKTGLAYLFGTCALLFAYLPMTLQWPDWMSLSPVLAVYEWLFTSPVASCICGVIAALLIGLIVWAVTRKLIASLTVAGVLTLIPVILCVAWPAFMAGFVPNLFISVSPYAQAEALISYNQLSVGGVLIPLMYTVFFLFLTVKATEAKRWM